MKTDIPLNALQKTYRKVGSADSVSTYEYDASGKPVKESVDINGDGNSDRANAFEYDASGNLTQQSYDFDNDGIGDRTDRYEYDDSGNLTKESFDYDGNGQQSNIVEYEYDASGNQVKVSFDYDGDGKRDRIDRYEYDADGNRTKGSFDYDGDGTTDDVREYSYERDAAGNLIKASYDNSGDGNPESISKYGYDPDGNQTQASFDANADGIAESVDEYEYDTDGNLIKASFDTDGDGTPNAVTQYEYDANGNLIQTSFDTDGDGVAEETTTYIYSIDSRFDELEAIEPVDSTDPVESVDSLESVEPVELVEPVNIIDIELVELAASQSMRLRFEAINLEGVGELRIFNLEEDGSRMQLASFFALEGGKLAEGYSPEFSVDGGLLSSEDQLQFELVEDSSVWTSALTLQDNTTAALDFGDRARLVVAFDNEAIAPNLLREDATTVDLTGFDGRDVTLNFSVYREASYDNMLCFYRADDASGGILDAVTGERLQPGDEGYEEAAVARQLATELSGQNGEMAAFSTTIAGGDFLGMFLIVDGSDAASGELLFSSLGANGGNDHVKLLGNNTFGFEDTVGMGDRDFNDMVVKLEVA